MPDVSEWFERVAGLPSFVRRFGYIQLAKKALRVFNPNATPEELAADVPEAEEELDLFADEEPVVKAAAAPKKEMSMKEKAKASAAKKKVKAPVIAKSSVMFEVKPLDDTTDLDVVYKRIRDIKLDGLIWGEDMKKVPVAFGIFKLIVVCVVEDEKVSVDDVQEKIEAFEDAVQSVEIAAFNKI